MDNSILLQKQVKDNSEDLRNEFLDMKHWEEQMKKADAEIRNSSNDEILPPVRRKKKASKDPSKPQSKENDTKSKRIKSYDYSAWEKFDVNKACEELDEPNQSDEGEEPLSKEELEKNHQEATEYKVMGNNHVKKEEWVKAIGFYNKAIKIFPYDAVFFANRALCQLKLDNLHSAEADCTAAIQLDEFYVKAYHRRATARISLKQYKEAIQDVHKILKMEPSNKEAKSMLDRVNKLIEKSQPLTVCSTPEKEKEPKIEEVDKKISSNLTDDSKNKRKKEESSKKIAEIEKKEDVVEIKKTETQIKKEESPRLPEWLPEVPADVDIVQVVTKAPHLRSKKPLRSVPIGEIDFGAKKVLKKQTDMEKQKPTAENVEKKITSSSLSNPETSEFIVPETPKTAVQFLLTWKKHNSMEFRYQYLKQIPPACMPKIFKDSMESDIFSGIIKVLRHKFTDQNDSVFEYLKYLTEVKRFRTLTMFLNKSDKEDLIALFEHVKKDSTVDDNVEVIMEKYEI